MATAKKSTAKTTKKATKKTEVESVNVETEATQDQDIIVNDTDTFNKAIDLMCARMREIASDDKQRQVADSLKDIVCKYDNGVMYQSLNYILALIKTQDAKEVLWGSVINIIKDTIKSFR